jgi:hypothetical protein
MSTKQNLKRIESLFEEQHRLLVKIAARDPKFLFKFQINKFVLEEMANLSGMPVNDIAFKIEGTTILSQINDLSNSVFSVIDEIKRT